MAHTDTPAPASSEPTQREIKPAQPVTLPTTYTGDQIYDIIFRASVAALKEAGIFSPVEAAQKIVNQAIPGAVTTANTLPASSLRQTPSIMPPPKRAAKNITLPVVEGISPQHQGRLADWLVRLNSLPTHDLTPWEAHRGELKGFTFITDSVKQAYFRKMVFDYAWPNWINYSADPNAPQFFFSTEPGSPFA